VNSLTDLEVCRCTEAGSKVVTHPACKTTSFANIKWPFSAIANIKKYLNDVATFWEVENVFEIRQFHSAHTILRCTMNL
jgi:hypothetical protein